MKLTEDMVVARSRGAELNSIRKLNCWGSEISDVAVVRKLPNIEVLALSVNNISTLVDFQYCQNLAELYIRQNNIQDLNEVVYLKELPKLKALWLADNPCAKRDGYRLAILRALPHLQKLDNAPVESEEVQKAMIQGEDLVHPLDALEMQQRQQQQQQYRRQEPESRRSSHASNYGYQQQAPSHSYNDDPEPAPPQPRPRSPDYYPSQHQQQQQQQPNYSQQPAYRESSPPYYESSAAPATATQYYEDSRSPHETPTQRSSFSSYREPTSYRDSYREEPASRGRRSVVSPERQSMAASDGDGYRGGADPPISSRSEAYSEHSHSSLRQHETARPKRKSPNVLSAVLCLIKELDLHGLEVVDTAVRCRIQELED